MLNFFFCHIYYWRPLIQLWNFNTKRPMSSLSDLKYSTWGFYPNFFIVELNLPNCFQCEIFYDKLIFLLVDFCFSWLDVYFFGKNGWLYIIILKIKLIRKLYQTNIKLVLQVLKLDILELRVLTLKNLHTKAPIHQPDKAYPVGLTCMLVISFFFVNVSYFIWKIVC